MLCGLLSATEAALAPALSLPPSRVEAVPLTVPLTVPLASPLHRSDNSFSFFVFFFVFFCQIGIYVIQLVGIPGLGDR